MKLKKPSRSIRIPIVYGVFSILWIILTDWLTLLLAPTIESATQVAIIKGSAFVLISTLLIYFLLKAEERYQASIQNELKTVQESFSQLFDRNPQPMWIDDPNTMFFLAVNKATCELYGYSCEEFLKLQVTDLCAKEELPLLIQTIQVSEETYHKTGPWKQVLRNGKTFYANIVVVTIDYAGSKANMITIIDISQQKMIEDALKKTEGERDDFEAFGYSVSHDLRAPLRAVTGYGQILIDDYGAGLDERARDYLGKMLLASQNMNQTIDNLLMLSRIKHDALHPEYIDLGEIASEIINDLKKRDPARNVEVKLIPEVLVKADANLMRVALTNLLENAWKYTSRQDKATIEFDCQVNSQKERVFYIRDNGAGFDITKTTKMFKPFQRFHTADQFSGSGIGLSIVARIIERHGGHIWGEGAVGRGATFYFTLGLD